MSRLVVTPLLLSPTSRSVRYSFLAVIVLGTIIRLVGITTPLHGDELVTISIWGNMPLLSIPTHYEYPNNHIFHTLVVATIFKIFGLNPFLLRTPVLVCGIASIALAFLTTHRITRNAQAGLAVSLLIAINGGHIFYSTHARGYMLILLICQYIFHRLVVWIDESKISSRSTKEFFTFKELSIFAGLMVAGTWTIPTFVFFEGSLGLFFLISFLQSKRGKWFDIPSLYLKNLTVILICLLSLFVQYFIFISPEMLAMAFSNAAQSELSSFPTAILKEWIQPIDTGELFVVSFVLIGLFTLFHLNRTTFILIVCLLVFPPTIIYIACLSGLVTTVPHVRVFFYLQPIFILCVVIGAFGLTSRLRNNLRKLVGKIVLGFIFLLVTIMSGKELLQVTWPDRFARQPLDLVAKFVKSLGPNDLILLSHSPHVEYYLYGGKETTKRVNKIIDEGKLGDIYFVEYGKAGKSDSLKFNKEGVEYLRLNNYFQVVKTKEESTGILLPMKLFASERRIGNFTFRKVNSQFVYNSYTLRSPKDWKRWSGVIHSTPVILEPPSMHTGKLPALKIKEPGTLIAYSEDEISDAVFSININLVMVDRHIGKNMSYLHAVEEGGHYVSKSAWLVNEWVLDHPYGPDILNQHWQTKIFITEGKQPVEIIRIPGIEQGQFGRLRGIQSYRLVISKHASKTNGDKL